MSISFKYVYSFSAPLFLAYNIGIMYGYKLTDSPINNGFAKGSDAPPIQTWTQKPVLIKFMDS